MTPAATRRALVQYYVKAYKDTYGVAPNINAYAAQWIFDATLTTLKVKEVEALIDFYFTCTSTNNHDLTWFAYNYDNLVDSMAAAEENDKRLQRLRQETEARVKEWRERGNNRTESP